MLIKKAVDIKSSEITSREVYLNRRAFIRAASLISGAAALGALPLESRAAQAGEKLPNIKKSSYSATEKQNSFKDITNYNNFYELGTDKEEIVVVGDVFERVLLFGGAVGALF